MVKKEIKIVLEDTDEIIEREVKKFGGNAGHFIVPNKHIGKMAKIIFTSNSELKKIEETEK